MAKPIGILGGTFDPVHHGHLRLALEVQQQVGLEQVYLVPLYSPPHRSNAAATPEQRLQMLDLATEGVTGLQVNDIEIKRQGTSYSIDTVRDMRESFSRQSISLIMGMDAFSQLDTWRDWQKLTDYVHIIAVDRPGSRLEITSTAVADLYDRCAGQAADIHDSPAGRILLLQAPMLDISSSRVRKLVAGKLDIQYLVPANVITYIHAQALYQQAG